MEFRDGVVAVARRGEAPIAEAAKDLGITESCLRNWLAKADIEDATGPVICFAPDARGTGSGSALGQSEIAFVIGTPAFGERVATSLFVLVRLDSWLNVRAVAHGFGTVRCFEFGSERWGLWDALARSLQFLGPIRRAECGRTPALGKLTPSRGANLSADCSG